VTINGGSTSRNRFGLAAGVIGVILCCLPFYVSAVPPLADLPAHILVARILLNHGDAVLRYSEFFEIQWAVAPTSLFYAFLLPLQKLFGPIMDARVYLTIWVAGIWLSVAYLARVLGDRNPWTAALLALPLAFCGYAYQGYLPFLMSMPLFALAVAVWFSDWMPVAKLFALWILLALLFGFHIVGAAAAGAVISIAALVQAIRDPAGRRSFLVAVLAVAPLFLLTVFYLFGQQAPSADIRYSGAIDQVLNVVKFTIATLDDRAAMLMLLWLAGMGVMFILRWRGWIENPPLLWGTVLIVALSIAMPGSLGALWPAGPRLLPFALILLISGMSWSDRHARMLAAAGLLLLAGMSAATTINVRRLDQGYRDILGAAAMVEPGKHLLPIMGRPVDARWTSPYLHAGDWITLERGGTNPFVLATPYVRTGASPLVFRHEGDAPLLPIAFEPGRGADYYREISVPFDYVLAWGPSAEMATVLDAIGRDMTLVYERGHARLFARHGTSSPP